MYKYVTQLAAITIFVIGLGCPTIWAQNTVQTIAGGGPNNLPALKSSMGSPAAIAIDAAGNVYAGDLYSERVIKVDTTGTVTIVAGTASRGYTVADGIPAIDANLAYPSGVAVDGAGDIFIADSTFCRIRKVSPQTGIISTVAGTGNCWYSGDGGPATSASLNRPFGVAVDGFGDIIIADTNDCLVREVSASTGVISTLAGTVPDTTGALHCGYSGDGGSAAGAKLGFANGLAVDPAGNVIIADTTNCAVRKISISTGVISTVAGTGICGYSGNGGSAIDAQLSQLYGVAVDRSGNLLIADTTNCVVRKVSASTGDITTVGGNYSLGCGYSGDGSAANASQLGQPDGVAVDSSGDIFIADCNNSAIREVSASTGDISTFAGVVLPNPYDVGQMVGLPGYSGDGYSATDAELGFLNDTTYGAGLATDANGDIFIADTDNNVVREVSASTGIITTVAGDGIIGYSGDGGPATSAELFYPRDVAVDRSGNIFIVDSGNCVIRKVAAATGIITTVAGTPPDSAGNYYCGFSGDGGPATSAQLYPIFLLTPAGGVAVDNADDIFVADTGNAVIREVSAATGIITTVAGIPCEDFCAVGGGDGGPATAATMYDPFGVAVDGSGNIFIADTYDYAIREVMAVNGNIYTVAGNISLGPGYSGDGGPADSAQLGRVFGLFVDPAGNLFIPHGCVIREVSSTTGNISTVAGTRIPIISDFCGYSGDGGPALSAVFDNPSAVAAGNAGGLVVLDNVRVRTVADLVQGPAASAVPFPDPLAFPGEGVGTSNTMTVMLSNRGSLATSVSTLAISGANASDFSETDNCANRTLAVSGGSCAINVKFSPSIVGIESAQLSIADTVGMQNVGLTGTGVAPPGFSPSTQTISFGYQLKTVTSNATGVTVTNNGASNLNISGVAISGANANDFGVTSNSCTGITLMPGLTCTVDATFTPSTTGDETAMLVFTDNVPGGPQSVGLSGTGTDFSIGLAPGGSATATVSAGSPATYNLQVTPVSGFNGMVSLSCTGAPPESTCIPSATSVTPTGNTAAMFSLQITTIARSGVIPGVDRQWRQFGGLRLLSLLLMVALALTILALAPRRRGAPAQQRRAHNVVMPLGFLLLAIILIGCGGGGSSAQVSDGTAAGSYTLTITGTSNSVSRSQTLTLTVN